MKNNETGRGISLLADIAAWLRQDRPKIADADTRARTWARRVDSFGQVPETLRGLFDEIPPDEREPFPYSVLTPTFRGIGRRLEPERLVCLTAKTLYVLEARHSGLEIAKFHLRGKCIVERGVVLLYSWIRVSGTAEDGTPQSCCVRFNSITDHLMAPFVDALRAPSAGSGDMQGSRLECFNSLAQTHYKFYSRGRSGLRPCDCVARMLFQPEVRDSRREVLGFTITRRISPAHLTVLTPSEVILIRDASSRFWLKDQTHGAIWTHVPREMVRSASLEPGERQCLRLTLHCKAEVEEWMLFEASVRQELQGLVQELQA